MQSIKTLAAKARERAMCFFAGCISQSIDAPFNSSKPDCKQKYYARALGSVAMYNCGMAVVVEGFVRTWALFSYARLYDCVCEALIKQDMQSLDATLSYFDLISCFNNSHICSCANES